MFQLMQTANESMNFGDNLNTIKLIQKNQMLEKQRQTDDNEIKHL